VTSAGPVVGRLVEVEAYDGPEDRASHARFGPRSRARSMFGPPGRAYVYGVYGMHTCLNVVCGPPGRPSAVLLRAAVPLAGVPTMRAARLARALATRRVDRAFPERAADRLAAVPAARLAAGPGNLAAAFAVERADDGLDLLDPGSPLRLEPADPVDPPFGVLVTARVGVAYAGPEWAGRPWRFVATAPPAGSGGRLPPPGRPGPGGAAEHG
jgi:DNA-3-methyladenine glycosylase